MLCCRLLGALATRFMVDTPLHTSVMNGQSTLSVGLCDKYELIASLMRDGCLVIVGRGCLADRNGKTCHTSIFALTCLLGVGGQSHMVDERLITGRTDEK